MTRFETRWDDQENYVAYLGAVGERLREFASDGLLEYSKYHCRIKDEGRAFLRNICMAFDPRLASDSSAQKLFSRTI
jgi:oxygen-independent coproporphyrinogen-3 oxidase